MKNYLKKLAFFALITFLFFSFAPPVWANNITKEQALFYDGSGNSFSITLLNNNGVYYIYPSDLSKLANGSFSFDPEDYNYLTSKLITDENELIFKLDSKIAIFNGKYFYMNAPMRIVQNRIVIPLEFVKSYLNFFEFRHYKTAKRMIFKPNNGNIIYTVQSSDTLWILSQTFGTTIDTIKNLNNLTNDVLYIGQKLIVKKVNISTPQVLATTKWWVGVKPIASSSASNVFSVPQGQVVHVIGKRGNFYKISTPKGTGYVSIWALDIIQDIQDTSLPSNYFHSVIPIDNSKDSISYIYYKVQSGDTIWSVAVKFGIPNYELMSANNLNVNSYIYAGQTLKVPVHTIAINPNESGVEMLDWFSQGNYIFPIGAVGKFIDIHTGKYFFAKRTMGASHADVETVTAKDTQTMKEIFGGNWTWERRPFILEVNGRRVAVSVSGMPHAGVDGVPYNQNVANRSGGYGYGPNLDTIANGMDGHFDVYTFNGLRHKDNQIDPQHQLAVSIAAGLK